MSSKKSNSSIDPILEKSFKVPSFKLQSLKGDVDHLSLKGSWHVLYFYPKDMTSGCTSQARDFQAELKSFGKGNVSVLGVSKDSLDRHEKFALKESLSFNLLSDPDGKLCEDFGVIKEKSMYGRKYIGIERSTFLIDPNLNVVACWRGVKVPGHVQAVLEIIRQIKKE